MLVFTSDPLTGPLEIIGPVRVIAHVATSAADTDITAKLVDVHPGDFAQRLCDGMVRLRYRDGFDREQPVTPGETYEVEIPLWDTCVRLPAGHRLRVEIASSAFPKYDVNLGTGGGHDHRNRRRDRHQPALAHAVPSLAAHRQLTAVTRGRAGPIYCRRCRETRPPARRTPPAAASRT